MSASRRWSLGTSLALWYAATAFALVALATVSLYWSLSRTLATEDALMLGDRMQAVEDLLSQGSPERVRNRVEKEWTEHRFEHVFVRVIDTSGKAITESPGFASIHGIFDQLTPVTQAAALRSIQKVEKDGRTYRAVVIDLKGRVLQIALDRTREFEVLLNYRKRLAIVLAIMLIVCAIIGREIALRGIQPVKDMADQAGRIGLSTLHERLPIENLPDELRDLARTFNEMLDRLAENIDRLSRFSSDMAHELRTPIGNLRGEIEVALGKPRTVGEYSRVLDSLLEECGRISRIIDSLLFLARAENPAHQIARERVDLGKELETVRDFYEALAADSGLELEVLAPEGVSLEVERTLFQRALGNLLSNAINYTARGGRITVSATLDGGFARITVRDTGTGIAPEHLPRIFDRFYRVDQSRSTSTRPGGHGLGLAIVKSIAQVHGGSVEAQSQPGRGTSICISLPAPGPAPRTAS